MLVVVAAVRAVVRERRVRSSIPFIGGRRTIRIPSAANKDVLITAVVQVRRHLHTWIGRCIRGRIRSRQRQEQRNCIRRSVTVGQVSIE